MLVFSDRKDGGKSAEELKAEEERKRKNEEIKQRYLQKQREEQEAARVEVRHGVVGGVLWSLGGGGRLVEWGLVRRA